MHLLQLGPNADLALLSDEAAKLLDDVSDQARLLL
jgi:hypothetical protein